MRINEIPQKKFRIPDHYAAGQQPTQTGLHINLIMQDLDFTAQTKGGYNMALRSNPLLFKSEAEYKAGIARLRKR